MCKQHSCIINLHTLVCFYTVTMLVIIHVIQQLEMNTLQIIHCYLFTTLLNENTTLAIT